MILINKSQGLTPLETIQKFKDKYPSFRNKKLSYAGRLDPMAQGLLIILEGDENKNRRMFESYDKTYKFTVLFGMSTDTYDLLGMINNPKRDSEYTFLSDVGNNRKSKEISSDNNDSHLESRITNLLQSLLGEQIQAFPPYSSKSVNGKPMYWWARNNKLDEITIPYKKIVISRLVLDNCYSKPAEEVRSEILNKLKLINGDFRQEEIKKDWKLFFEETKQKLFFLANFTITCSSGTYVRTIVNEIGQKLNSTATTYAINRIRIGEFVIEDSIDIN